MKKWYKSKTIISAGITLAAVIFDNFGMHITGDQQTAVTELILKGVEIVGPIVAIYGRSTATGGIGNENISKSNPDSGNSIT
ncbi:MAG: hypothetical protein M0R03_22510 [Novosphingobium sp.]|jgi:hypothetical protein|nr:hypothetical protein [Novosphingobium sp.]